MLDEKLKSTIRDAAKKLTGTKKREFMAQVTIDYFGGSSRKAETHLGWKRQAVQLGLKEKETGISCYDNYHARGRKKVEVLDPQLATDIENLASVNAQTDPKFKSTLRYTRVSARAIKEALILSGCYSDERLPSRQTIGNILNRMGYRLKKH